MSVTKEQLLQKLAVISASRDYKQEYEVACDRVDSAKKDQLATGLNPLYLVDYVVRGTAEEVINLGTSLTGNEAINLGSTAIGNADREGKNAAQAKENLLSEIKYLKSMYIKIENSISEMNSMLAIITFLNNAITNSKEVEISSSEYNFNVNETALVKEKKAIEDISSILSIFLKKVNEFQAALRKVDI